MVISMVDLIQILDVCNENTELLKTILFIKTLLKYLLMIIPSILIVLIIIDLSKNVMAQKEENFRKNVITAGKRILYCIILFIVPSIVGMLFKTLGGFGLGYIDCIANAEKETIVAIEMSNIEKALDKLETDPTRDNLEEAKEALTLANDVESTEAYEQRLKELEQKVNKKEQEDIAKKQSEMEQEIQKKKGTASEEPTNPGGGDTPGGDDNTPGRKAKDGEGLWVAHMKNSKELVDKAIKAGFWGIEVDVYHDGNSFELKHPPREEKWVLNEFLDTCKKNNITAVLHLQIRSTKYEQLVSMVKEKGMQENTIYQIGINYVNAKKLREIDSNARIWACTEDKISTSPSKKSDLAKGKEYFEGVNMLALNVDKSEIDYVHSLGMTICSYSYNDTMYNSKGKSATKLKSWGSNYLMANAIDEQ